MQAGRIPGKSDIPVRCRRETSCFPSCFKQAGLKPSLATTTAKASERVIADPLGWERSSTFSWVAFVKFG
ncbi:hypothetical protein [Desulfosporosinus fructosivorans]